MIRRILFACLVALLFTLTLNARSLREWGAGRLSVAYLNDHLIDERLYFSIIAKTGQGAAPLGHSSYREHRQDSAAMSMAPVIEGLPMRWLGLSLENTLLIGDLLWPFVAVFFLTLGLLGMFAGSWIVAGALALTIMSDIGIYWFRASNPQVPIAGSTLWLAIAFLFPAEHAGALFLRGIIAGGLTGVHMLYASFFIIADGTLMLLGLLEHRSWRKTLRSGACYALGLVPFLIPRFFLDVPPEAAADTLARVGVIHSRLPAAPMMQAMLLGLGIVLFILWWRKTGRPSNRLRLCLALILSSLIALNQSLIHGWDAIFVAYYTVPLRMVLILSATVIFLECVRNLTARRVVMLAVGCLSMLALWNSVGALAGRQREAADQYAQSDVPKVLTWLRQQPGETLAIAAPNALNERIPYETPHYVLFNEYGWNQQMTDRELAERYALQVNLIPSSKSQDRTYTFVFGGYAGLTSAKQRAFCRIKRTIFRTNDPCTLDARTLIRHQELLPMVDNADVNIPEMMKKYHVSFVVTEEPRGLPPGVRGICKKATTIGTYGIWSCGR